MADVIQILLLLAIIVLLTFKKQKSVNHQEVVIDSCGLIDGRIVDLMHTGFVSKSIIIPDFILDELQILADGRDSHKRQRARYGLEVAAELKNASSNTIIVSTTATTESVDNQLLTFLKKRGASLYTTDYNLQKVAEVNGVPVMNINQLTQVVRPIYLPGERITVKINKIGDTPQQGVGYLDDGTMVVVSGAGKTVGRIVNAEVTQLHQTASGKMLFAKKIDNKTTK